jgi:hypothetical protein
MEANRNAYKILTGYPTGKRTSERPRHLDDLPKNKFIFTYISFDSNFLLHFYVSGVTVIFTIEL